MVKEERGDTMMNLMEIDGYSAVIKYDPEIEMFRGEFINLNGGADFYAADIDSLKKEGAASLKVFLEMCVEDGVEPRKTYSGRFNVRIPAKLHAELATVAAAKNQSLNRWVADTLDQAVHSH